MGRRAAARRRDYTLGINLGEGWEAVNLTLRKVHVTRWLRDLIMCERT